MLVQLVKLLRDGAEVKMSKRTGEFITMREVIDEVGADAAKFYFLMRDSKLIWNSILSWRSNGQPTIRSIMFNTPMREFAACGVWPGRGIARPSAEGTDLTVLTDPDELGLIKKLSAYPEVIQSSALAFEPHRVTYYLQQLAALLHTFYNKHRILPPAADQDLDESLSAERLTPARSAARLVLMRAVQQVLGNGLEVLGISAPEHM